MAQAIFMGNPILDGDQVIYNTHPPATGMISGDSTKTGKGGSLTSSFKINFMTEERTFKIRVDDVYEKGGEFGYVWTDDGATTWNGATKSYTFAPIDSPFLGVLGTTTFDQPGLTPLDNGDMLAYARKWTDAAGKQIVCKNFSYNTWSWGSETVISSVPTVQGYPSAINIDGTHVVMGFIDDTDATDRKINFSMSDSLDCDDWAQIKKVATSSQIYNLSLHKQGEMVVAAYDDGTDVKCRVSFDFGISYTPEADEITIQEAATDPFVLGNGDGNFLCLFIEGGTPTVHGKMSEFGESWISLATTTPDVVGNGTSDTMSDPCGFVDDNGDIIAFGLSDAGKIYMRVSTDVGGTWSDITALNDDILPNSDGFAVADSGAYIMASTEGLHPAPTIPKSIGAMAARAWTKDIFLTTPLDHDYLAIQGKPENAGWARTGTDEAALAEDYVEIDTDTPAGAAQCYFTKAFSPTITNGFVDIFRVKVTTGGGNDQSCIRRYDINSGISACLAFSTADVTFKDLQDVSDIGTDAHDYTAYHDFVVAMKKSGSNVTYNIWRKEAADPWNGIWTLVFDGPGDGYLAEGGSRTTQTGFGDNSVVGGENSISRWHSIVYQDQSDDTLAAADPTLRSRRKGGRKSFHPLSYKLSWAATSMMSAVGDLHTYHMESAVDPSNLFSTSVDSPLFSSTHNVDWEIYIDSENYKSDTQYYMDSIAVNGMNVRKVSIYGTNDESDRTITLSGGLFETGDFPGPENGYWNSLHIWIPDPVGSWTLLGLIDSYAGDYMTLTAVGQTYATDSAKAWQYNQWKGYLAEFDDQAGNVKSYPITSNTNDTLLFEESTLVTDGFTSTDLVSLCTGAGLKKVSASSYRFIKVQVDATLTYENYYKIGTIGFDWRYEPDTELFNPDVDDSTPRLWTPNNDVYVGRSGARRVHKLGPVRKSRTLKFLQHDDTDLITEKRAWFEYIDFENTPVFYVPDDAVVNAASTYYDVLLGRFLGGMREVHDVEDVFSHDEINYSEEV